MAFLPILKKEMTALGWDRPDIVVVTGDAYVDHPSFGTAIVSRVLEKNGFRVCIISQPQCADDISEFGEPKLAFFVNGGNIDPMVAHYTVAKKKRTADLYTPGSVMGKRPDRATITYCKYIKEIYPNVPIAIGGLEASLRRFAHYDYWDNQVLPSILSESRADILMYGMGEKQVVEIASRLKGGERIEEINDIRGTCILSSELPKTEDVVICPSLFEVKPQTPEGFKNYAISCRIQYEEHDYVRGKVVVQKQKEKYLIQNKPMPPLTQVELDEVYDLPYERNYHPSYEKLGGVKAIEEVKFSIAHNRGCFGSCNFCAIAFHQGRSITCRSKESILKEAEKLVQMPDFKGYIHDVGGPTANFRHPSCNLQKENGVCKNKKCLAPSPCKQLIVDHKEYLDLLRSLRNLTGVKKVFIRSGIRFDYLLQDKDESFFKELVKYHVSGQLKVAPEHCSDVVLDAMGKPHFHVYKKFRERFYELTKSIGKKQYLVPYLMSSHPGSTVHDAISLALFLKKEKLHPEQVQDFYPTPGTVSTCMFYTGLNPFTLKPVYVAKSKEEKAKQRAMLQYYRPENHRMIRECLKEAGREDLIGFGENFLVPPEKGSISFLQKSKTVEKPAKRKTSLSKHLKKKKK
ncbi:MAG: YgiQ family radical SAM protein [Clostridia bacterium]|nr:YgiQ family radical SAM protein [Clostridia bacterium]